MKKKFTNVSADRREERSIKSVKSEGAGPFAAVLAAFRRCSFEKGANRAEAEPAHAAGECNGTSTSAAAQPHPVAADPSAVASPPPVEPAPAKQQQQPTAAPPPGAPPPPSRMPPAGVRTGKDEGTGLVVGTLLARHVTRIERLRELLADEPLFDPGRHDGLFLLRFLLSHKLDPKRAVKACRRALAIRQAQGLDELGEMFRSTEWWEWEGGVARTMMEYLHFSTIQPDPDRGLVITGSLRAMNTHGLMKEGDLDAYRRGMRLVTEWQYQRLDAVTRRTGVIVKAVRVLDARGFGPSMLNMPFYKMDSEVVKDQGDLYPQFLGQILILNAPGPIKFFWDTVLKHMLPTKVTEKIGLVDPANKPADRPANRPDLLGGSTCPSWRRSWSSQSASRAGQA